MEKKKKGMSVGKAAVIGMGVAATGAGAYYLFGPKGKQHQKKAKDWMAEMKMKVEEDLKKVKNVTESLYHNTIDSMAATYSKKYREYADEINAFAKKLKSEWKCVGNEARSVVKKEKSIPKKDI